MNFSSPNNNTTIPPSENWIGDLLFQRPNRPLKYTAEGPLILVEMFRWTEVGERVWRSIGWLSLYTLAIVLNFGVLALSMRKTRQQAHHKKVQFLLGSLAVCNIVLALGLLVYTFLLDVYYEVDSFDTLVQLNRAPHAGSSVWHFAKFLIHSELVENFFVVQQLVLLLTALDRYLTLFERYTVNAKPSLLFVCVSALPYVLALVPLDRQLLSVWMPSEAAVRITRLLSLLCPLLLSLVLSSCSIVGLLQQRRMLQRVFGPAQFQEQFSFGASVFAMLCMDAVAKFGLFLELLQANFSLRLTLNNAAADARLLSALSVYYWFAHQLLLLSPLLHALVCLTCVAFYRRRVGALLRRSPLARCTRRAPKLDYSCETMRSIIADQTRARQMRTRVWGEGGDSAGTIGGASGLMRSNATAKPFHTTTH